MCKSIGDMSKENQRMKERIKRLEKALDLVTPYCSFVHHSKKHQHAYNEPCPVVALIEKTKEAKL
jgi:archaellum component FlaC